MRKPHHQPNSIISASTILVVEDKARGRSRKQIRIVQYQFANGTAARILEKRSIYPQENRKCAFGERLGLNANDIEIISSRKEEIIKALQIDADTLAKVSSHEKQLPDGKVEFEGKVYDEDKFY